LLLFLVFGGLSFQATRHRVGSQPFVFLRLEMVGDGHPRVFWLARGFNSKEFLKSGETLSMPGEACETSRWNSNLQHRGSHIIGRG
jgi:hypothetical protein